MIILSHIFVKENNDKRIMLKKRINQPYFLLRCVNLTLIALGNRAMRAQPTEYSLIY